MIAYVHGTAASLEAASQTDIDSSVTLKPWGRERGDRFAELLASGG